MPSEKLRSPKRVMACVDGSKIGFRAADFAIALGSRLGSEIIFVNVVGAETSERNYNITADMVGSFELLGREALAKCKAHALKKGIRFETLELAGDPADEILKSAKKMKCDCIVIGKKGLGRLERLFLGSVSEKVLKLADVPVIIVK